MKVCVTCGYSFKPQIDERTLSSLFYSDIELERFREYQEETLDFDSKLRIPEQIQCANCISNGVPVERDFWTGKVVQKKIKRIEPQDGKR